MPRACAVHRLDLRQRLSSVATLGHLADGSARPPHVICPCQTEDGETRRAVIVRRRTAVEAGGCWRESSRPQMLGWKRRSSRRRATPACPPLRRSSKRFAAFDEARGWVEGKSIVRGQAIRWMSLPRDRSGNIGTGETGGSGTRRSRRRKRKRRASPLQNGRPSRVAADVSTRFRGAP
jgi:hypothetical protein